MSREYTTIDLTVSDTGRATVTLDRPDSLNALDDRMAEELLEALETLPDEPVRVMILRGRDGNFCAGADVGSPRQRPNRMNRPGDSADCDGCLTDWRRSRFPRSPRSTGTVSAAAANSPAVVTRGSRLRTRPSAFPRSRSV